jgi:hypothetical protein
MSLGRSQQPAATAAVIQDKTYTVAPAAMKVKDGIVTGEISEMKVTERVEQGSDRVVSPAKLTAKVVLKNSSANQTVRLVAGKIQYIDAQGPAHHARAAADRADLKFATYGSSERLDPAQEATQSLDVDFPGGDQFRRVDGQRQVSRERWLQKRATSSSGSELVRGWCLCRRSPLMLPSFPGCQNQGHVFSPGAGEDDATDDGPR